MEIDRARYSSINMVTVLLDTSFLIHIVSRPIVNFELLKERLGKVEFVVLEDTLRELEDLCRSRSLSRARAARSALNYASKLMKVDVEGGGSVDDKIVKFAIEKKAVVATLDNDLKRKLRERGIPVIILKDGKVDVTVDL
ncbi:MAG: hypothetical protein RMJ31_06210 [Nitrososphaerota archaeon]|nr:hypothetical protein [Nitrososphaerota archaeon]